MQKNPERPAPPTERPSTTTTTGLRNWDGTRVFLEVARSRSFRAASQTLHTSANTLRRQLEEFEHEIGIKLLTRHVDGVRLTAEGELLLETAIRMEAASLDIARVRNISGTMEGEVRLSITEGLGTFWVAPRLVEFQRAYPQLLVDMRCTMHPADVLRLETDVSIQLTPPTAKDLRVVKLGRVHAMPFASPDYLENFGVPHSIIDVRRHRMILQVTDQITTVEAFSALFPNTPQVGTVAFRTNTSSTHYWIIARGAGIGMLPTYAPLLGGKVVPVDIPGTLFSQDIWLTYHPDAAKIARIRRLIDWLIEAFNPRRYPWFSDTFIHPKDMPQTFDGNGTPLLFEGFEGLR